METNLFTMLIVGFLYLLGAGVGLYMLISKREFSDNQELFGVIAAGISFVIATALICSLLEIK